MNKKVRYAENGVLPPVSENPMVFKKNTRRQLVVKTKKPKEKEYDESNPNPLSIFKGVDGRWYKITIPAYVGNCYSFALGIIYNAKHTGYYLPGFLVERYPLSKEDVPDLITKDLAVLDRKVHEVIMHDDIPETLPKAAPNTYWVKIMFDNTANFHITRLDEVSGRWIHILGWGNPPKVVMRNLEIADPIQEMYSKLVKDGKIPAVISKDAVINYIKELCEFGGIPLTPWVGKSQYEDDARAPFLAYDPEKKVDGFVEFETYAVMRIDY